MTINEYLTKYTRSDYQRNNFDEFLEEIGFSFNVPAIHVAGTNGKGSVCSYISSIYQSANYKVGLFTSPSLFRENEMIQINNVQIKDDDFINIVKPFQHQIDKYNLSPFEIMTFVALTHFKNEKCDIAIIECGLGGELDATNIFIPILSIITSVSLEHTDRLGKSLTQIASAKAGIIKNHIPTLIGELDDESQKVIADVCLEQSSQIFVVNNYVHENCTKEGYEFDYGIYKNAKIKSNALYSVKDASIALEAINILREKFPCSIEVCLKGLASVSLVGRNQILQHDPLLIVDGGHNPEAIENLIKSLEISYNNCEIHVIFASFKDKNIERMLANLNFLSNDITITTFDHVRARKEEDYFLFLSDYSFEPDYISLINNKIKAFPNDIILVTGSLAFIGRVIQAYENHLIYKE